MVKTQSFSESQIQLARIAKALSHPARVYIMERLLSENRCDGVGCCTSGEMIGDIPIARSTLSQHLKELKLAGLIQGEIELPTIRYCVNTENWEKAKSLFDDLLKFEK
ncbi:MAG: transcriptional regulator [Bacteroidetes bacterium HGW-Bacteroidetes-6]|nr:MAG: transcriptional regulator [Bacteroidetes bacterium HGW-Bacteroidetes-6]